MSEKIISVGEDFSRFPAGRVKNDGDFSAEVFRDDILIPALKDDSISKITLKLDGVLGYSSSFLEETFGGLVRAKITKQDIENKITLQSTDRLLIKEINQYIEEA